MHSRSRLQAYAGLVPDDVLARVTPEEQAVVWSARMAMLPERHVALVVEQDREVVELALRQIEPESRAELNAIHVLPDQ